MLPNLDSSIQRNFSLFENQVKFLLDRGSYYHQLTDVYHDGRRIIFDLRT